MCAMSDGEVMVYDGEPVLLTRKRIKNMYLRIAPDGRVSISAPLGAPRETILAFLAKNWAWAKKKQADKRAYFERGKREHQYQTGERILVWGVVCELVVRCVEGSNASVCRKGNRVFLDVPSFATHDQRRAVIEGWYRALLQRAVPAVLARCERIVGKKAKEWRIRNMKTRWGTCNVAVARVWLNLQLAKYKPEALEYVVTHELTHLWVKNHGADFKARMDACYPDWRRVKKELNDSADFL